MACNKCGPGDHRMFGRQKAKPFTNRVGLDIGTHSVTGVEIVQRGSEIVIHSASSVAIPGDRNSHAAVVQAIKNLWYTAGFHSKRVLVALPSSAVYTKWLNLEAQDEEELANTARTAAARGAPFPASDAIIDYRVLSTQSINGKNVHLTMLVAASGSAVELLLNTAEAAGLDVLAVDIESAATTRIYGIRKHVASQLWSGQPQAHCQIGANSTLITVSRAGKLEFARTVPVAGGDFTDCISDTLQISKSEAEKIKLAPGCRLTPEGELLASHAGEQVCVQCESVVSRLTREMDRSFKYFRSQFAEGSYLGMTGAATLSGGGALLRGIDSCLERQGLEIAGVVNPFTGLSVAAEGKGISDVADTAAQYTTAVGLALADHWSETVEHQVAA
ncbi:MAG: type IV pilus assembly protein PilM [Armatimonadota bacterium]|jgi:type IV pilus assembly protein PilM